MREDDWADMETYLPFFILTTVPSLLIKESALFFGGPGLSSAGRWRMLCGRWDAVVAEKWRITLPSELWEEMGGDHFFLKDDKNCLILYPFSHKFAPREDKSRIFQIRIDGQRRFHVPPPLRSSPSFYFGRKVTFAGKGDHLEIWPSRP